MAKQKISLFPLYKVVEFNEKGGTVQYWLSKTQCPICGQQGRYRSGYEFEHQMRCFSGCDPAPIWIPGEAYLLIKTPA